MFKKILLPVDLSDRHRPALNLAVELVGPSHGEVVLVHVIELIAGLSMEEEKDFYARLEKSARIHLRQLGSALEHHKVSWQGEVLYGNRGAEIVRYATETRVDLIVLTAPRLDPDNVAAEWGSLSYKISVVSPCPVLLVK